METREQLFERRDTHLDQLADKLKEPRVHGVIGKMLGDTAGQGVTLPEDDLQYLEDPGLIRARPGRLRPLIPAKFSADRLEPVWIQPECSCAILRLHDAEAFRQYGSFSSSIGRFRIRADNRRAGGLWLETLWKPGFFFQTIQYFIQW